MLTEAPEMSRLLILVQRLLDADLVGESQGATLLATIETACRHARQGHSTEACRLVEEVATATQLLVQTEALPPKDGQIVITAAKAIVARIHKENHETT